jgi:hypothetical protein
VVILAQYGLETDCKIILRALLDSIFVFGAICKDENFAWEYINSQKASNLKQINSALNNKPGLFDKKTLEEFKKQSDILSKEKEIGNFRSFDSIEIAEKAELSDVYLLAYRPLCIDVHTLPDSLNCFLDIDGMDKIKSIKLGPKVEGIKTNLCEAVGALLYAVGFLCVMKGIDKEAELMNFKEKLRSIQN